MLRRVLALGKGRSSFELTFMYEKSMEKWLDALQRRERVDQMARVHRMRSLRHQYGRYVAAGLDTSSGVDRNTKQELGEIAILLHRKRVYKNSRVLTDEHLDRVEQWLAAFKHHCETDLPRDLV